MREIIIPKNDDFRTVFNPVILITFSVVLNTIFQIKTSEEVWNSFNIFNFNPDNNVLIITLFFFFFFLIGAFSSYCFLYNKIKSPLEMSMLFITLKNMMSFLKLSS